MKKLIYLVMLIISFVSCQEKYLSYNDAMNKCLENVTISEFELENGEKGVSYSNLDINCIKGAQLPEFITSSLDGKEYHTKDLKGKINIINFWFKACKPCVAEIPGLNIIANRYIDQRINFLSISYDDDKTLNEFVSKNEYRFIHFLNGKEIIRDKFKHKFGFPTTIITNRNLEIVEMYSGGNSDTSAIQETVNKLDPIIKELIK